MMRWLPWVAALLAWNLSFDLQVRRAGEAFVADQLARRARGDAPVLIRHGFRPAVRRSALVASGIAGGVLVAGLGLSRRRAPVRPSSA